MPLTVRRVFVVIWRVLSLDNLDVIKSNVFAFSFAAKIATNECDTFCWAALLLFLTTVDSIWHGEQLCMMKADSLGLLDLSLAGSFLIHFEVKGMKGKLHFMLSPFLSALLPSFYIEGPKK